MNQKRKYTGVLVAVLAGCASPPGTWVSGFDPAQQPILKTAPADGTYGLFIGNDTDPLLRTSLRQGDPLGFDRRQGGTVGELQISYLVAVGGTSVVPLQNGKRYTWRAL